ncbi:uncharacterized protein LOC130686422 [Daphnia carinata]|uniref:uncharacterized protein LOC130686422 n=1 Tax=Daphnia carinata TaxID=120202 RepID=UPI002580EDA6|nr:uncharacterized protein LOC130686422 [Daphnia carinata]
MKVLLICAVGCWMMSSVVSMPVAQKSSLDHLIIPYENSPVDYGVFSSDQGSQYQDEPTVITTYNVGTFRQGDFLTVPLGASYTVGGPDHQNRLKKGIVVGTKRFSLTNTAGYRPGIVL